MRQHSMWIAILSLWLGLLSSASAPAAANSKAKPATGGAAPAPSALAGLQLYQVDSGHSAIQFSVAWFALSHVHGTFSDFRSTVAYDSADVTRSSISVAINTASLFTANDLRDKDLKGADWFDVQKFPRAIFRSTSVEKSGDSLKIHGELTIRDLKRPVTIDARDLGIFDSPFGRRRAFAGRLALNRNDYGLVGPQRFNVVQQAGKKLLGDEVEIDLELQATAQVGDQTDGSVVDSLAKRVAAVGVGTMVSEYRGARGRAAHPDSMIVTEDALNALGYRLLRHNQNQQALEVFSLEAETWNSAFAEVGLGQSYAALGQREASADHCRRALQQVPNATRAMEILRRVEMN
ncbi:MAG TPA: YceI family protein [Candidatus Sulfotelmatobacter sp.]|nr:YceI family protein [Candidatus Sulfotelmatobacter sp.]